MASKTISHSKTPRNDLTADYVWSILDYDQLSGLLRWRARPREHFATNLAFRTWNTRFSATAAGTLDSRMYRHIRIDGRLYKAHRLVWLHATGTWPAAQIDHVNGNPGDNSFANLREATSSDNCHNCKRPCNNTSGFKGVSFYLPTGRWVAKIQFDGRTRHLGYFDTPEAAHTAYCEAARELHGAFARFY